MVTTVRPDVDVYGGSAGGKGASLGVAGMSGGSWSKDRRPPATVIPGQGGAYGKVAPSPSPAPTPNTGGGTDSPYTGSPYIAPGGPMLPDMSMSDDDWLATDQGYLNQVAALQRALEAFQSDYNRQLTDYDTDFGASLGMLGYRDADNDFSTLDDGQWLYDDRNTAAGRGMHSLFNDFAGRGMIRSTHFDRANEDFKANLARQLASMGQGRQRFRDDQSSALAGFQEENEAAKVAARQAALDRRAIQMF